MQKNIYLRKGTIFEKHKNTPVSVLYNIMELWIYDEFNVKKIKAKIEDIYSINNIDQRVIYSFIADLRISIANFIRSTYCIDPLAYKNGNQYISCDESLFTHTAGIQQWVVGLLNTQTKNFRIELVDAREQTTLKTIITKHVLPGNNIVTVSWPGYNFLNDNDSGYIHIVHNHSIGHFGSGIESTSIIESIWGQIKSKNKSLYHSIPSKKFPFF